MDNTVQIEPNGAKSTTQKSLETAFIWRVGMKGEFNMNLQLFRTQISEDILGICDQWGYIDSNLSKPEYAFNYWILSRIFNVDEEMIPSLVTEYSDKGIDCYVHYEESKELHLIQNKYLSEDTVLSGKEVSYFLKTPLAMLRSNQYRKSQELQNIFNKAKDDSDYKLYMHVFTTTNKRSSDIEQQIKDFNNSDHGINCFVDATLADLSGLWELYYGKNYREDKTFIYPLGTINKGTFASLREEYGIESMYEAYYIVTPVTQIYKMLKAAEEKGYALFEKNIREYLGSNSVNNGIVETLKNPIERKNFMYYNNGITVICQKIQSSQQDTSNGLRKIPLVNPQIVNGCQTVSSICKVLDNISENDLDKEFKNVFVMLKALVIEDSNGKKNREFYENVVKYTNKQNAISEKAFVSNLAAFYRLQEEFQNRGFLLLVKPSDKNRFKESLSQKAKAELLKLAKEQIRETGFDLSAYSDIIIPLEKLLQVFIAFIKDGYYAFTKKSLLLKQDDELFKVYCSQIHNFLTVDNMINLYCLYKEAESARKISVDKRTPIPYYVIGFFGNLIDRSTPESIQRALNKVFSDKQVCSEAYKYLVAISKGYKRMYSTMHIENGEGDYNVMIKRPIDKDVLRDTIDSVNDVGDWIFTKQWQK